MGQSEAAWGCGAGVVRRLLGRRVGGLGTGCVILELQPVTPLCPTTAPHLNTHGVHQGLGGFNLFLDNIFGPTNTHRVREGPGIFILFHATYLAQQIPTESMKAWASACLKKKSPSDGGSAPWGKGTVQAAWCSAAAL